MILGCVLALCNAGISLLDVIGSQTVTLYLCHLTLGQVGIFGDHFAVDPTREEERDADATVTVCLASNMKRITNLQLHGVCQREVALKVTTKG